MSTAKSMAASYLNGKRISIAGSSAISSLAPPAQHRAHFKSSASNLASSAARPTNSDQQSNNRQSRLKATSMTNLISSPTSEQGSDEPQSNQQSQSHQVAGSRIRRPASRNALDSIHNGMNSKYAQVQSKVYLQNIKPAAGLQSNASVGGSRSSLSPATKSATLQHPKVGPHATPNRFGHHQQATGGAKVPSDRTMLLTKLKNLQEANERGEEERERLRLELERERADKADQVQQLKLELQEKLAEHDKQNEEYHQKLLEAYELADQNRRAADSVLSESRQRDEEARKRIEELDSQLAELKEFVAMKEEMTGKMFELREQIREERERYEGQLKSLHQVFENEKLSNKMDHNSSNSNYFKRIKPSLQSSESINKPQSDKSKCRQCQSAQASNSSRPQLHQHHCSEQDIYGSKLSTRMQDTAKSAWKASKHFASSVITGGVNLSACRQCTKRGGGAGSASKRRQQQQCSNTTNNNDETTIDFGTTSAAAGAVAASCAQQQREQLLRQQTQAFATTDGQHTSVIKLEAKPEFMLANCSPQQSPKDPFKGSLQSSSSSPPLVAQRSNGESVGGESLADSSSPSSSLIRVDENNKLTIVTKFSSHNNSNNDDLHQQQAHNNFHSQAAISPSSETARSVHSSANGSERGSRCESSSSGRGTTASETGSATASQNGDIADQQRAAAEATATTTTTTTSSATNNIKQHRRKSSLFKASKVFSGSQVSLNKLRNFFSAASTVSSKQQKMMSCKGVPNGEQQQQREDANFRQQSASAGRFCADNNNNSLSGDAANFAPASATDHLESSRIRCMELNRAIKVASMAAPISVGEEKANATAPIVEAEIGTTTKTQAITTLKDNISKVAERDDSFEATKLKGEGKQEVGQGGCIKLDCELERAGEQALVEPAEAKEKQHVGNQPLKFEQQPVEIGANSQSAVLAAIESC